MHWFLRKEWSEINEFDPSKLKVSAKGIPMHEKDSSAFGDVIVSNGDIYKPTDFESSPVIGNIWPFTYETDH